MLNDFFARRYQAVQLHHEFEERHRRLLVQAFKILAEDLRPYYIDGKKSVEGEAFWKSLHNQVARELGLRELSQRYYAYTTKWAGNESTRSSAYDWVRVCETWMLATPLSEADNHIKERLSLIELGFRIRANSLKASRETYEKIISKPKQTTPPPPLASGKPHLRIDSSRGERFFQTHERDETHLRRCVEELNERFRQAGCHLNYHNGFIQVSEGGLISQEIEEPFWRLVASPLWENVDYDMKEAIDLRDTGGRDPAFYSARSLESAIKIISDEKGWTRGSEKGAHNYIDNLSSKKNNFISQWEADFLKSYFSKVRNPLGHGPGHEPMPSLSPEQTEWAIEFAMSWIKLLIRRL